MVGDDAHGGAGFLALPVGEARKPFYALENRREGLRIVDRAFALQDRSSALDPHPGVDTLAGKGFEVPLGGFVVLHEHVVPYLKVLAAGTAGLAVGAAGLLAGVDKHLRIRTAGSGGSGGPPPVVAAGHEIDPLLRHSLRTPDLRRLRIRRDLFVPFKDRHGEMFGIKPQPLLAGEKFPAHLNGALFEVVPQGPIAEHLKEGKMGGIPHRLDVAGANTLLVVDQPRPLGMLLPEKVGNQRMHTGGGKEHRRVVLRYERFARNLDVIFGFKKFDIFLA